MNDACRIATASKLPPVAWSVRPSGVEHIDRVFPSLLEMEQEHLTAELSERQLEQGASLLRRINLATQAAATAHRDQRHP